MRAYAWIVSLAILCIHCPPAVFAEQASLAAPAAVAPPLSAASLDRLLADVLRRNPGVQAKRRAYEAARARVLAAWLPDDPDIGTDVEGQSRIFKFDRTDNEYTLSQSVPFPTTLILRGRLAMKAADAAYEAWKEEERTAIWHIEQPYYELVMARRTIGALEQTRALLDRVVRVAQSKYESSQASQADVLKAEIERSRLEIDIVNWQQREQLAQAHLSHVLNQSLETVYEIAEAPRGEPTALSPQELEALALRVRPELRALQIRVAQAKTGRWIARTAWLPQLTGRIEARQFSGEGSIREYDTFLGMTVPVWSVVKGVGGEWSAASRDVDEAEAMYQEEKNEVLLALHEAYAKITASQHAVAMYEHVILPQAQQQVDVALSAYEAGRMDFLVMLDAQRMLRDLQVAYYGVAADYDRGLSDLRHAIGGEWPSVPPASAPGAATQRSSS